MTVMRRGRSWSFVAWVPDGPGRRQVWRGGYRTKVEAAAAERRFLVELEDESVQVAAPVAGPTVEEFLTDWLVQSEPTRRATTSVSYERCVRDHVMSYLGEVLLRELAQQDLAEVRHHVVAHAPLVGNRRCRPARRLRLHEPVGQELLDRRTGHGRGHLHALVLELDQEPPLRRSSFNLRAIAAAPHLAPAGAVGHPGHERPAPTPSHHRHHVPPRNA